MDKPLTVEELDALGSKREVWKESVKDRLIETARDWHRQRDEITLLNRRLRYVGILQFAAEADLAPLRDDKLRMAKALLETYQQDDDEYGTLVCGICSCDPWVKKEQDEKHTPGCAVIEARLIVAEAKANDSTGTDSQKD